MDRARSWHLATAGVATFAVLLQLVLVIRGGLVLDETDPPGPTERVVRFFGYFTVLSNILVAYVAWSLAVGRAPDRRWWRVLRLDSVVAIAVTGVVHWFLLRPILQLEGADRLADTLLHVVVPVLAVTGWVLFGPRHRVRRSDVLPALAFPLLWLAYTLVRGWASGFYPYPFIDVDELGGARVALNALVIAVLFVVLAWGALELDQRLAGGGRPTAG